MRCHSHGASPVLVAVLLAAGGSAASAQQTAPSGVADQTRVAPFEYVGGMQPVMDNTVFTHVLLEQAEDRWNGRDHEFRYDGQAWSGTDYNKLWLKSEGTVTNPGRFEDGQHEVLYDRAVSTYFDLQAGVRVDLDSARSRTWAAFGLQGLSLYFFDVEATAYASDTGHYAGRLKASYDLPITNRLILQPEAELNFYTKSDPGRRTGTGLSDIDTGLRLRYEISRKFAPYVGVSYSGLFGQSATLAQHEGESASRVRLIFGLRTWF